MEALAVVGDATPHVLVAAAGLPLGELGAAQDALVAAGLLAEDGVRFAHGLIATVITDDLPCTEQERLHGEAARALMAVRADPRLIAGHLLRCAPQADPAVSACLQDAARIAEPAAAAAYLERALAECAPGDDRWTLLARLGTAGYDAGRPDARRHLREALREVSDRESRIAVLTRLAALHLVDAADDGLAQAFEDELARETDVDVRLEVEVASLDALLLSTDRHHERAFRAAAIELPRDVNPLLECAVHAHRAWVGVERGLPGAGAWAELALRALEDDLLLGEAHWRAAYALCARVLTLTDHAAAGPAIRYMREAALERGSLRLRIAAEWYAAGHALRTGAWARPRTSPGSRSTSSTGAGACSPAARSRCSSARSPSAGRSTRPTTCCATTASTALGPTCWEIGARHARARLWLAEGDFERAHAEAAQLGALPARRAARPVAHAVALDRRAGPRASGAARGGGAAGGGGAGAGRALRRAGADRRRPARPRRRGARSRRAPRALRARAGARRGRAVGLEAIRLRLELGGACAALGRRPEARVALRPALADADAAGAVVLAARARRELVATGLRPARPRWRAPPRSRRASGRSACSPPPARATARSRRSSF